MISEVAPTASSAPKPSRLAANVILVLAFFDLLGIGILLPNLPGIGRVFSLGALQLAILVSVFSLAQLISAPLMGRVGNGRRVSVALSATTLVGAASYGLFAVSDSYGWMLVFRILAGSMAGNVPIAQGVIVQLLPHERTEVALGRFGMMQSLGFIAGLFLGSLSGLDVLGSRSYAIPFFVSTALGTVASVCVWMIRKQIDPVHGRASRIDDSASSNLKDQATGRVGMPWRSLFTYLIVSTAYAAVLVFLSTSATEELRWGGPQIAALYIAISLTGAFARGRLIKFVLKLASNERASMVVVLGMIAVATMLGFASADAIAFVFLAMTFALFSSIAQTLVIGRMAAAAPVARKSVVLGAAMSALCLGSIIGPPLTGALHDLIAGSAAYWGAGGLSAVAVISLLGARDAAAAPGIKSALDTRSG